MNSTRALLSLLGITSLLLLFALAADEERPGSRTPAIAVDEHAELIPEHESPIVRGKPTAIRRAKCVPRPTMSLHEAARSGNLGEVEACIHWGCYLDERDKTGFSPLEHAILDEHRDVVSILLEHGADYLTADSEDITPLAFSCMQKDHAIVEMLLSRDAPVEVKDENGMTPLMWASRIGCARSVELLLVKGAEVHARDADGRTPFLCAARSSSLQKMKILLAACAKLSDHSAEGWSPMHWAAHGGNERILAYLISEGLDANERGDDGMVPLMCAARAQSSLKATPFPAIYQLLIDAGADIALRDHLGNTLLHHAAVKGRELNVRHLLENGADPSSLNQAEQSPYEVAFDNGHKRVADLVWEYCPKGDSLTVEDRATIRAHALTQALNKRNTLVDRKGKANWVILLARSLAQDALPAATGWHWSRLTLGSLRSQVESGFTLIEFRSISRWEKGVYKVLIGRRFVEGKDLAAHGLMETRCGCDYWYRKIAGKWIGTEGSSWHYDYTAGYGPDELDDNEVLYLREPTRTP